MRILDRSMRFEPWRGLFETLWVDQGKALFCEEHWSNLCEGARILGLKPPESPPELQLAKMTGRLRWILYADHRLESVFQETLPHSPQSLYSLALAPQRIGKENWDARFKTLSYLTHAQARESVQANEALLLNEDGHVASGAMSNIFWFSQGRLFTPPLTAGSRNGVIRQWLCRNFSVEEKLITPLELLEADAIAITNSYLGIQPITRYGSWICKNKTLFKPMQEAYAREVADQLSRS